jgi:hypothetical protein
MDGKEDGEQPRHGWAMLVDPWLAFLGHSRFARASGNVMVAMMQGLAAGLRYFAGVFVAGFALGTLRTLWLAPAVGELAAVAAELPIMLAASWWWCRRLLRRWPLGATGRGIMGGTAFFWLMLAELGLSLAFGRTVGAHLAGLLAPAGLLGLAGQLAFAAMPLVIRTK